MKMWPKRSGGHIIMKAGSAVYATNKISLLEKEPVNFKQIKITHKLKTIENE